MVACSSSVHSAIKRVADFFTEGFGKCTLFHSLFLQYYRWITPSSDADISCSPLASSEIEWSSKLCLSEEGRLRFIAPTTSVPLSAFMKRTEPLETPNVMTFPLSKIAIESTRCTNDSEKSEFRNEAHFLLCKSHTLSEMKKKVSKDYTYYCRHKKLTHEKPPTRKRRTKDCVRNSIGNREK